ncbi:putative membrane protein YczE [Neobacillus niacini]|uniref:YczE/YyaS/YitT family protein n=1 Tax=Neobacillus driksii TaxID=3035913 RepID=UPI00277E70C2|nr:membrane protein [Neobacillus niacini]MDQ0973401.1 putative membrane protein YczE [Neobacillus niacini]
MALFYRFLFLFAGLSIMTFGVCLTIKAELGAGAWDALNVALTEWIGLTIGSWIIIEGAVLVVINSFLVKRKPQLLSLLTIILIGSLVDLWMFFVFESFAANGLMFKFVTLILGIFIIGLGAAIYLQAKFPSSPIDSFMMAIRERFSVNLMTAKTIGELVALFPALLLQGPIGIGTIIITFTIGPFVQLCFPFFEKLMNRLLEGNFQAKY